eukprot:TRINITY_DN2978_c0_g1_i1.p1 TRINITY_DN2978_c0_g1~~TRINITY_DN2978_c0_g1_i1.p1  ORF type:complete len:289 (-),score=69.12 TRINITY_DN2978_c0_g1_i1:773-1639(-)
MQRASFSTLQTPILTASMGRKAHKSPKLRTSYQTEVPFFVGEVEALLKKKENHNIVLSAEHTPRPIGMAGFETDNFRKLARVWQTPASTPLPDELVSFNPEPGFWVISPKSDLDLIEYTKLLESLPWQRIEYKDRKPIVSYGESMKGYNRDGLQHLDRLLTQSIDNFIRQGIKRIAVSRYEDEVVHLDNDINRARMYLMNYSLGEDSKFDSFVEAGAFIRATVNNKTLLRPTSDLFKQMILLDIDTLEKKLRKEMNKKDYDRKPNKIGNYTSHITDLKNYVAEHWKQQ